MRYPTGRGRQETAFGAESGQVKRILALVLVVVAAAGSAAAEPIPLPRPRPVPAPKVAAKPPEVATPDLGKPDATNPDLPEPPSACRLRLTSEFAIARSIATLHVPAGCVVSDVVRLEAIVLPDKSRVAVTPPATLGCPMAEALAHWVREDLVTMVQDLGSPLRSIDNYASFDCRGRNNIAGAKLSEHGRANALDIRSLKLADGRVVKLVDPHVAREFRESMRKSVCGRFSTVLGPGSDGYHEDHVHVDLMDRAPGRFRMCQWDVRDPAPPVTTSTVAVTATETVPLPPPRPHPRDQKPTAGRKL
jgi:hypothetical protein